MKDKVLKFTASNSAGVAVMQAVATLFLFFAMTQAYESSLWVMSFCIYFLTGCLGVTVTFHRYLSHKSFQMPKMVEYLFSVLGSLGGTGSPLGWVALHRAHHEHADLAQDPHSPENGLINIILSRYQFVLNKWSVRDLIANPFHRVVHGYYHVFILIWAALWLSLGFKWFLFVVMVPIAIQIWVSILSNCLNHRFGYRNFVTNEKSTNNFFVALLSWGEGWHNNHHRYPERWSFQVKWWELDISALIIRIIRKT